MDRAQRIASRPTSYLYPNDGGAPLSPIERQNKNGRPQDGRLSAAKGQTSGKRRLGERTRVEVMAHIVLRTENFRLHCSLWNRALVRLEPSCLRWLTGAFKGSRIDHLGRRSMTDCLEGT
jgi:hypothetical protein